MAIRESFVFLPDKIEESSIGSIEFGNRTNRTHRKIPVLFCSIIEKTTTERLGSGLIQFCLVLFSIRNFC